VFVSDVMTAPALTVTPATSIKAAARLLRDRAVSAVPVVDDDGALVGMVSEIDLLRGSVIPDPAAHLFPVATSDEAPPTSVGDVMTPDVSVLLPHSDLYDAARTMRSSGIRSLPVVDAGRVVGVVSRSDLLRVLARDDDEILQDVRAALAAELGPHADVQAHVVAGVVSVSSGGRPADLRAAAWSPGASRRRGRQDAGRAGLGAQAAGRPALPGWRAAGPPRVPRVRGTDSWTTGA
jgi:CBS domain-containing protein